MPNRPTPTIRRVFLILILALAATVLAAGAAGARAAFPGAPGPIAVSNSDGIELIDPQSGAQRQLLGRIEDGSSQTAFFPSGEAVAYIGSRLPACAPLPPGPKPCVTEYALFVKSLAESDPDAPGRMVVPWGTLLERSLGVSADGTRIVFAARTPQMPLTGGALELYSVSAEGGPITRLTRNRVFDGDPEVSPDGRRIAFVRRVHGLGQIFTMRANGTDVVRLTHDPYRDRMPSWSPDGRTIAFFSRTDSSNDAGYGREDIFTVSTADGRERRLTHPSLDDRYPAFSPDGRQIAFVRHTPRGGYGIWLVDRDGSDAHPLPGAPPSFAYDSLDWGPSSSVDYLPGSSASP
jgi:dipeptidyl aminopeptidase/acylaminoacyl peptidase